MKSACVGVLSIIVYVYFMWGRYIFI